MRPMQSIKHSLFTLTLFVVSAASVFAEGRDFVIGDLRVDQSEVYGSKDYKVSLMATDKPAAGEERDFTASFLGVFLTEYTQGVPGSGSFSQVGLKTEADGIRWFVYAEPGVTCPRGSHPDDWHCYGNLGDLVSLNTWHQVELVRYGDDDFWIARVYEANGTAHDVAHILHESFRIHKARCDMEQGYFESSNPYLTASFRFWNPEYMDWSSGFQTWPESRGSNVNRISTAGLIGDDPGPDPCPSHYGANPYLIGESRYWFAGSNGKWCDVDPFFPADQTYLPDVQGSSGRDSVLTVRNNSDSQVHVQAAFRDGVGDIKAYPKNNGLSARGTWSLNASDETPDFDGSAIVYGSEDVSAVVVRNDAQRTAAYTGLRWEGYPADPNWQTVSALQYLPHVYHDKWGYTSALRIMNAGGIGTNVQIDYRDQNGLLRASDWIWSLASYGTTTIEPSMSESFFGTAEVSSGEPLAVVADSLRQDGAVDFSNTGIRGASSVWLPYLLRPYYYGWRSCYTVRNLDRYSPATVNATYYWPSGSHTDSPAVVVPPEGERTVCPEGNPYLPGGVLSAKVWSPSSPIVVAANRDNPSGGAACYSSVGQSSHTVIFPHLAKNANIYGRNWISGLVVQNTGSQATTAFLIYYSSDGSVAWTDSQGPIAPGSWLSIYLGSVSQLPAGFQGSAVVTADQPLAAIANGKCNNCSGDVAYTYNAVNR